MSAARALAGGSMLAAEDLAADPIRHAVMHILRYNVLKAVHGGGHPSAEENPADLLPDTNRKRTGTGMA